MENDVGLEREKLAKDLTQFSIWRSVVQNVIKMENTSLDEKIEILFQAVPDLGIILSQLSLCKSLEMMNEADFKLITKASLLKLIEEHKSIDFNPLFFSLNE
ncbi:MAG: hypothetical protein ACXAD7_15660 [Candidatus Kariarchaeaceae archaeon]